MEKIIGTGIIHEGLEISEEQSAKTHAGAIKNIEKLNKEMGDDWRLPTREELDSFVGMKGATDHFLWTSTPYYSNGNYWVIEELSTGGFYGYAYTTTGDYRCVREVSVNNLNETMRGKEQADTKTKYRYNKQEEAPAEIAKTEGSVFEELNEIVKKFSNDISAFTESLKVKNYIQEDQKKDKNKNKIDRIIGTEIIRGGLEISEEQSAKTHAEAVENIEKLNKEMGDDWRLPTREELDSFVGIEGATDHFLWTSTPDYSYGNYWVVEVLSTGYWYSGNYTTTGDYRCVRKV